MNAPARLLSPEASPPYNGDTYGWALRQAELLKARRFAEIDLQNIIEEIETVGRSERRSLASNIEQILIHVIKWDFQPERRGMSWWLSIMNHRDEAERDLHENPSLRSELPAFFDAALRRARRNAAAQMKVLEKELSDVDPSMADVFEREYPRPEED